jgi:MGT family glycosyltransferase
MAKGIFYSIPAHGHTNPTLPLVRELVENGEEIIYYSTVEFKEKIEAAGASFREYPSSKNFDVTTPGKNLGVLFNILVRVSEALLDPLLDEVADLNPDYIIHDAICLWGKYIAAACNLPGISSVSTFAFSAKTANIAVTIRFLRKIGFSGMRRIQKARVIQKKIDAKYGVTSGGFIETVMNVEGLNIVYTSKEFQPHAENFESRTFKFVGPSIAKRRGDSDLTDYSKMRRPLVYISMGTIWTESFQIGDIIRSLAALDCSLVISGVRDCESYADREDIIIRKHVNQLEVLPHCDAFVCHGGMNSVSESLLNEVPLCVFPFQSEQEEVAKRIVELGCGLRLRTLGGEEIRQKVSKILGNPDYKRNCSRMAASFRESGGYKEAVKHILAYTRRRISVDRS